MMKCRCGCRILIIPECLYLFRTPYLLNVTTNEKEQIVKSGECRDQRPRLFARPCERCRTVLKRECNMTCRL
jgi:hypothetical protein